MLKKFFQKITRQKTRKITARLVSGSLIFSILLLSFASFYTEAKAQAGQTQPTPTGYGNFAPPQYELQGYNVQTGEPIYRAIPTATGNANSAFQPVASAVSSVAGCSVGQILGNMITGSLTSAASSFASQAKQTAISEATTAAGQAASAAVGSAGGAINVNVVSDIPTTPILMGIKNVGILQQSELSRLRQDVGRSTAAEYGGAVGYEGVGTGSPSWNSIAFCIANQMIQYIGDSTVRWIQSGFKGNPVFIDDTGQFFKNVADQEAGAFVQQLVGNAAGIDVCQPFRVQVAVDTINQYTGYGGSNYLNCSLSEIKDNYEGFTGGDWSAGGFPGYFELLQDENNVYGASMLARQQQLAQIQRRQNTLLIDLNWSKGYRSFDACTGKRLGADGQMEDDPATCRKTTLGGYIENQVNERGASGLNRLYVATEFDQVVSALVNQLIKIAVNKVFEGDAGAGR